MNCGPACMAFVLQEFGIDKSIEDLAQMAGTDENGTRPCEMVKTFLDLGIFAEVRVDLDYFDLRDIMDEYFVIVDWWSIFDEDGKPALADGHYSVALDVTGKRITLYDPDISTPRKLSRAVFEAHWYDSDLDANGARMELNCAAVCIRKPDANRSQTLSVRQP